MTKCFQINSNLIAHRLTQLKSIRLISTHHFSSQSSNLSLATHTRILINEPSSSTTVRYALPLAFLTTNSISTSSEASHHHQSIISEKVTKPSSSPQDTWPYDWIKRFSNRGYHTATILINDDLPIDSFDAQHHLSKLEIEMKDHLNGQTTAFFPPLLFSKGKLGCLLAQTYVSSNPISGLVLISPPVSKTLPDFNFEPRFPIMVMSTKAEEKLISQHRLVIEALDEIDRVIVSGDGTNLEREDGFQKVVEWMNNNGF